jgi:hypothetical protein
MKAKEANVQVVGPFLVRPVRDHGDFPHAGHQIVGHVPFDLPFGVCGIQSVGAAAEPGAGRVTDAIERSLGILSLRGRQGQFHSRGPGRDGQEITLRPPALDELVLEGHGKVILGREAKGHDDGIHQSKGDAAVGDRFDGADVHARFGELPAIVFDIDAGGLLTS